MGINQVTTEEWRTCVGFEGYEVSNLGRVRSWRPPNGKTPPKEPRILKASPWKGKKYLRVGLQRDGKIVSARVHHLVLEAFVGLRPDGTQGRHLDDHQTNNVLGNLAWGTHAENVEDKLANGKQVRGSSVANAKLTEGQVLDIKLRLASGKHGVGRSLAEKYGVGDSAISAIRNGQTWEHVQCS